MRSGVHTNRWSRAHVCVLAVMMGLAGSMPAVAQRVEATRKFDDGTRLLASGDFHGAIEAYSQAEASGLVSGALYYNRAVAHYRLDEIGRAVQYFERASRLLDDQIRVRHSLEIVSTRLVDTFSELPVPIWKRMQRAIIATISVEWLMLIGISLYLLLCTFVLLSMLAFWVGPWYRRARLLLIVASCAFLFAAFSSSVWPAYPPEAVVLANETTLYEQPDDQSRTSEVIHEGLLVDVVSEGGEWSLIQLPNGVRGWVKGDQLGAI